MPFCLAGEAFDTIMSCSVIRPIHDQQIIAKVNKYMPPVNKYLPKPEVSIKPPVAAIRESMERAKAGKLVDGSGASCDELKKLIAVDKEALEFEKDKLEAMGGSDKAQKKVVADAEKAINAQVKKLEGKLKEKGCAGLKQAGDAEVYARADEGKLNSARVIERAKQGKLVDGSGATCSELESLIAVDKKAVRFEKDKLEAMGGNDPAQKKIVDDAEKAIEAQVKKLQGKLKEKGC